MSPDEIRERASQFQWYHTIDLGHGVVTRGDYDLRPLVREYGIPASLAGKSVLDVGPGHGFFSFEFERRGAARVTTAELPDWTGHDASPVLRQEFARLESGTTMEPYLHGALGFAIQALGLLAGAALARGRVRDYGFLFWALDPDVMLPGGQFAEQMAEYVREVKSAPRRPGFDEIRIPSERALRERERRRKEGIVIERQVVEALERL